MAASLVPISSSSSYSIRLCGQQFSSPSTLSVSLFSRPLLTARRCPLVAVRASEVGDFGARDPFPAEIESGFADKVLGNASTEHLILVPNSPALSLADRSCSPLLPSALPLSESEAKALLRKVIGWRLVTTPCMRLQCEWKVRDAVAGEELAKRISASLKNEGQHSSSLHLQHLESSLMVKAEIWTESIGGLSENDFILAAKIDRVKTMDLIKKNRVWH